MEWILEMAMENYSEGVEMKGEQEPVAGSLEEEGKQVRGKRRLESWVLR